MARLLGWLTILLLACLPAQAQQGERWVTAWAAAQQIPEPRNAMAVQDLTDATLRQIVRLQLATDRLRVRFSNAFGTAPLRIDAATIALSADPASAALVPASVRPLRFGGAAGATIPAGADYWSDPIDFAAPAGADVAVSIHLPAAPAQQTGHPGSRATSWFVHGDRTADIELPGAGKVDRWYQLAAIETVSAAGSAVVVLGDSITDGSGVQPNTNRRWTDALQLRLRADPELRHMAVLNAGLGGNRLVLDGLGPNALARFDRDVLSHPGVTHLIVLEGVNDLGTLTRDAPVSREAHEALVAQMIGAYRQIVARARAHGIQAIGATILPYGGSAYYHPDAQNEADRQAVNAWIRTPGNFDAVIDFDAAMRDPVAPTRLRKDYDNDGLHPSIAGYQAMADAVPLALLMPEAQPVIAFTFDDLPAHATLPPGATRVGVADAIIAALRAEDVPATGFINGARIDGESAPVLDAWRAAGLPLGNHGWSHASLDALTDAQFAEELARNEPILEDKMRGADWRWFRYPFLSEAAADPTRRARIRHLLADRGYKVASVTMSFSDWAYNDTYARCAAKGDTDAIAQMDRAWLEGASAEADRARAMAHKLHGRDIPYVLLMHLGAFDARLLPRLIDLYKAKGFRFVSLAEAERDPFYASDANPALPPQPQGLEGALAAKGLPVPPTPRLPPLDTMCR